MQWLRYGTLVLCVVIGLCVLALVIHSFSLGSQGDPRVVGQRVQDLQWLVITLLGLTGLYAIIFLLSPRTSERILERQADQMVRMVHKELSDSAAEFRDLQEEIRQVLSSQVSRPRDGSAEIAVSSQAVLETPKSSSPVNGISAREYSHLSGRVKVLNDDLVRIYRGLATLCIPKDEGAAEVYLNHALRLAADPSTASEIHYDMACLLTRRGELAEATAELQTAFQNKLPQLEKRLTKDTEEGGPLYSLAGKEPFDRILDDLLMDVSVGA